MWGVAGYAPLGLHRAVLKCERACFVRVTVEADHVLRGGGAQLPGHESAVRVVAIAASHQALIHAVMEWFGKIGFDFQVAAIAELRLRCLQKRMLNLWEMRRMAINAAHIVLQVLGARVVAVLFSVLVAIQAAGTDFLGCGVLEREDFRFISPTFHVGFAWAMTRLATVPFRTSLVVHRGYEMG